jgi:hypothetical protein
LLKRKGSVNQIMKKLAFLLFVGAGAQSLQADIIYSNFGSPLAFQSSNGSTVSSGGTDFSTAFSFLVQNYSYQVTGIDYAAYLQSTGGTNSITASIYTDNGGAPGTLLYTTSPADTGLQLQSAIELMDSVTGGPVLTEGSTYWLSLDAPVDSSVGWAASGNDNAIGVGAQFTDGSWGTIGTHVQGAFEVDGTIVAPEPVTTSLLASGLASLMFLRRYRSRQGK